MPKAIHLSAKRENQIQWFLITYCVEHRLVAISFKSLYAHYYDKILELQAQRRYQKHNGPYYVSCKLYSKLVFRESLQQLGFKVENGRVEGLALKFLNPFHSFPIVYTKSKGDSEVRNPALIGSYNPDPVGSW